MARAFALSLVLALARGRLVSQMRGGARSDRRRSSLALLRGGAGDDQLAERATLDWPKARPWLKFVRRHGVLQFISLYNQRKNDTAEELQWGDEIEYQLVAFDDESRTVRISLRADEILADLSAKERLYGRRDGFGEACAWHPEYGAWMVEGTPRFPYSGFTADLRRVETNMILRRTRLAASLRPGEAVLSIPAFPALGTADFTAPAVPAGGESRQG